MQFFDEKKGRIKNVAEKKGRMKNVAEIKAVSNVPFMPPSPHKNQMVAP